MPEVTASGTLPPPVSIDGDELLRHIAAINALEIDIQQPEGQASEKRWAQARHVAAAGGAQR